MLEEFDRFQVLISTVFICNPLSILFSIIKIQHGSHCIHTEPVHMVMLDPEQRISDQEVPHFRFSIVKDLRAPVRMLTLSRVRIFISRGSVKISESVGISREMSRYPVKDDTDLIAVQIIYHIRKVFRCSIPGRRCIVPGHLVSPGSVKRMLCHSHQLYMGIAHLFHIFDDRFRKLSVSIKALVFPARMSHPGSKMHFVDRHRALFVVPGLSCLHPGVVGPFYMRDICDDRCRPRS